MPWIALAFLAGIISLLSLSTVSSALWFAGGAAMIAFVARSRYRLLALSFLAGLAWALFIANGLIAGRLPAAHEGQDLLIEGVIADLPHRNGRGTRFELRRVTSRDAPNWRPRGRVRLGWYGQTPALVAGDHWRLRVRLKRPRGLLDPGTFDYESWLFSRRIEATGYVRSSPDNHRLDADDMLASRWQRGRQRLRDRLERATHGLGFAGILRALAIGDRDGITSDQWRTFKETGTSHLVAISGLHIGLVATWVFWLVRWLWSRSSRLTSRWPAPLAGVVGGFVAAAVYAALAGFALPTQRALIMLGVALAVIVARRHTSASHALAVALLGVLVIDPLVVLGAGLWLSFGAVTLILALVRHRLVPGRPWWRWLRLHLMLAAGLAPVLLALFGQASLVAPVANIVAIPCFGLAVVPLTLLALAALWPWPELAVWLLGLADRILAVLWAGLDDLTTLPGGHGLLLAPPFWSICLALLGVAMLAAPRGWPARWLGGVAMLPMLMLRPPAPPMKSFDFTLLDVGQGLAAVVRTARHVLVYDTGPRYGEHFDAGSGIIVPFLHRQGIGRIDLLMIGHGDADHIGGVSGLWGHVGVDRVLSSVPARLPWLQARYCLAGQRWRWDGVDFAVLHPSQPGQNNANDGSCVLKVGHGAASVLLTGDIEAAAERALLRRGRDRLRADVLVVPHHGSATSSTPGFIAAVAPRLALFPVGYGNRFGLPREVVVRRYGTRHVECLATADAGAIHVRIGPAGLSAGPDGWRRHEDRFWRSGGRFRAQPSIQYDGAGNGGCLGVVEEGDSIDSR